MQYYSSGYTLLEPPKKVKDKHGYEIDDPDFKPKMIQRKKPVFYQEVKHRDITWRAELIEQIMQECMLFLNRHEMLTTLAHKRVAEEFEYIIRSEIFTLKLKGDDDTRRAVNF